MRATGWDESFSRGRAGDTELTGTSEFRLRALAAPSKLVAAFFTRQRLPHESAEGKDKLRKISEVLCSDVRRVLSC